MTQILFAINSIEVLTIDNDLFFGIYIFAIFIIAFGGPWIIKYFGKQKRILRLLKKHPTTTILRAKQNQMVKISGRALAFKELLEAPISGRPCIYYQVIIEEKNKYGWHRVAKEEAHQDFYLKVRNHIALVSAKGSLYHKKMYLVKDHVSFSNSKEITTKRIDAFLKRKNVKSVVLLMDRNLRYREGIIKDNELITVLGKAKWTKWRQLEPPLEGYPVTDLLSLISTPEQKMIITDDIEARRKSK